MKSSSRLRIILIKPSKYGLDGYVERFRRGFMPNSTLARIRSLIPDEYEGCKLEVFAYDEYVQTSLAYLTHLERPEHPTLLLVVGTQSHQFQRAIYLALLAKKHGVDSVIGGPHPMTLDTTILEGRGVSFALAEAELLLPTILSDAIHGGRLQPVYGVNQRWKEELDAPILLPPSRETFGRHVLPMTGIDHARGCPFLCEFCLVPQIAGRTVRSQPIPTTIASLLAAKTAGAKMIMFTSDNFNKDPQVEELLRAMIRTGVELPFFVQCDTQIVRQPQLVELLARAGCWQMFVGVESFDREILKAQHKFHNRPEHYGEIVRLCAAHGITTHFSNIIGFPQQDEAAILEHLHLLRELEPDMASFYILTPIPGTKQFEQFQSKGWITETNLDRYDGTNPVWTHPKLTWPQLTDLLYHCYREFYSPRDIARKLWKRRQKHFPWFMLGINIAFPLFCLYAGYRRMHPMSGGVGQVRITGESYTNHSGLIEETFGYRILPPPKNTQVPEVNRKPMRPGATLQVMAP